MKTTPLEFRAQLTKPLAVDSGFDGEALMNSLLEKGIEALSVDWEGVGKLVLPVEDDAIYLFEAFSELNDLTADGTHYAFLGDGTLEVNAKRRGDHVDIVYRYSPQLDHRRTVDIARAVPHAEYVGAWTAIVADMLAANSRH